MAAARESIRLAFVAALQHLPARQRAVLILREVLRWQATEVAELLDTSVASVNSALQRARATLAARNLDEATSAPVDAAHEELLQRYVAAFERYDIESLVALLRDDAIQSMPPYTHWLVGAEEIGRWPQTIITGSGAEVIKEDCPFVDNYVPHLVIKGIVLAYMKYVEEKSEELI